jgi:hypothetical protein
MPRDRRYGGRTSIRDVDLYEGGYTPWERAGQAALSRTPEAFNYGSLEEKYPTRQVMPMVPSYVQNQIDDEAIARKEREVSLKVRQAQLNTYDSKLNEEASIAEQVQLARPEFASLNPQDADYQNKRDQLLIKYPMVESSNDFMRSTVARLDRINDSYNRKIKPTQTDVTIDDVSKAMGEISKYNELISGRGEGVGPSPEEEFYLGEQQRIIDRYKEQRGIAPKPALTPSTEQFSFSSVEEADASGLPKGTIVYINGRKARID